MTTYVLKTIACSGLLLLVYRLVFGRESMYTFNRFYLLVSLLTAFAAPLITITLPAEQIGRTTNFITNSVPTQLSYGYEPGANLAHSSKAVWLAIACSIYLLVTAILCCRFIINITLLRRAVKSSTVTRYKNVQLVLINKAITPYSVMQYIFVSADDYYNNNLEEELLTHELAHVTQRHTLDILFVELLQAVAWFNPFITLYKKAIQVNHELLADDAVIRRYNNVAAYQNLLLVKIAQNTHNMFASSFNYLTTKKRLTMMTKTTTTVKKMALQAFSLLLIGGSVILLSTKVTAQVKQKEQPAAKVRPPMLMRVGPESEPVPNTATQAMINEYEDALKSAEKELVDKNGVPRIIHDYSGLDNDRMNFIYYSMTDEQRAKATKCIFIPAFPPPPKKAPTAEEFKKWGADGAAYGVWIDGKRIANSKLATLNPNDYCYYDVSSLTPLAQKNDGFRVQVNISTLDDYNYGFALSIKYAKFYYALHKK